VRAALGERFALYEGETLLPPGTLRTGAGAPYSVFGAFARAFRRTVRVGAPLPAPRSLPPLPREVATRAVEIPSSATLGIARHPALLPGGERAARARLRRFLRGAAASYPERRDRLDLPGTSRLSADLKFGTISVRTVWTAVEGALGHAQQAVALAVGREHEQRLVEHAEHLDSQPGRALQHQHLPRAARARRPVERELRHAAQRPARVGVAREAAEQRGGARVARGERKLARRRGTGQRPERDEAAEAEGERATRPAHRGASS